MLLVTSQRSRTSPSRACGTSMRFSKRMLAACEGGTMKRWRRVLSWGILVGFPVAVWALAKWAWSVPYPSELAVVGLGCMIAALVTVALESTGIRKLVVLGVLLAARVTWAAVTATPVFVQTPREKTSEIVPNVNPSCTGNGQPYACCTAANTR